MNSTTVPILRYADAERAIEWLCEAFGFDVFLKVKGSESQIMHARLTLETNMVMLASLGRDGNFEEGFKAPVAVGGVTQAVLLTVANPDRIYASALAAGAKITTEIVDSQFGGRMFSCEDLESHVWVFTNENPWKKTW